MVRRGEKWGLGAKMFLGEYQPSIDEKGRLALPKKLREQIKGGEVILSRGFETSILGYDKAEWEEEAFKQIDSPISDSRARHLKQYMYSGAAEVSFDEQGRFVIPPNLRSYAQIEDEVTVIGAGDHFEIWETSRWRKHLAQIEEEVR